MREPLYILAFNASVLVFMAMHETFMHLRKLWTAEPWNTPAQVAQYSFCVVSSVAALRYLARKV
jgi:hypothetical protein